MQTVEKQVEECRKACRRVRESI